MSFYSARNVNITFGGTGIYATQASVSSNASVSPKREINRAVSEEFSVDNPIGTSLNISYVLTGVDPLKNHILNEDSPISVNFGGLYMNSGFLESYSFSARPYSPVEVSASIKFFEPMKGSFSPAPSPLDSKKVLLFSDFGFSEVGVVNSNGILDISYNFSNEITPTYSVQESYEETSIHNLSFGEKKIDVSITTNDLSSHLPESGIAGKARIQLSDANGTLFETYYLEGRISSQDSQFSAGDLIKRSLRMTQFNFATPPTLSSVTPTAVSVSGFLTGVGENLSQIESVTLLDQELEFTLQGNTVIVCKIPKDANSGPFSIRTKGGSVTHVSGITVI